MVKEQEVKEGHPWDSKGVLDMPEGRYLPNMDYRVTEMIMSNPHMAAEQGSGWLSQYGGPQGFVDVDKAGIGDVYNAIAKGIPTDQLPIVTGISEGKIGGYIGQLKKMGLVQEMSPEIPLD